MFPVAEGAHGVPEGELPGTPLFPDAELDDPEFDEPEFADPEFAEPEFADPEFPDPALEDPLLPGLVGVPGKGPQGPPFGMLPVGFVLVGLVAEG